MILFLFFFPVYQCSRFNLVGTKISNRLKRHLIDSVLTRAYQGELRGNNFSGRGWRGGSEIQNNLAICYSTGQPSVTLSDSVLTWPDQCR